MSMRFDAREFGNRIRDERKKRGLTQEHLSVLLNISPNHLAKVETGNRCCSIELLKEISACLNVKTDYLLNGDEPHNYPIKERLITITRDLEMITQDISA